jgi:predicted phosphodiesterase
MQSRLGLARARTATAGWIAKQTDPRQHGAVWRSRYHDSMRFRLLLIALLLAGHARPEEINFFLQMSDPQFGMYSANKDFAQETVNFEFAIATANRLRPKFVVICGDLVNQAGNAAQIAEFKRIAGKLDATIKLYNVAGNHDVENEPTPAALAAYRKNFGPDYYRFQSGDLEGFVLNSSLIAAPQRAQAEADRQEAWIKSELAKPRADRVRYRVVFQHHSWFLENAAEPDQYFNIPAPARQRYLKLFHDAGVTHVFAGHYHRNAYARDGSLEMITTGPVGKFLGKDPSGIRVVTWSDAGIEHQYYDLGSIPHVISGPAGSPRK